MKYKPEELADMEAYILSDGCYEDLDRLERGDYFLDYPSYRLVPKNFGNRKRAIYYFTGKDSFLIKLIAYVLHDLDDSFSDRLFSFRSDKKAHDLLKEIRADKKLREYYILKTDVSNYVGSIVPEKLLKMLSERFLPDDPSFYHFLETLLLRKKVYDRDGVLIDHCPGGMGGAALSNFFMNLYLHEMDDYFESKADFYSRYSDDILICAGNYEDILEYRRMFFTFLDELELKSNPDKTMIIPPGEPFDLLGMELCNGEVTISSHSMTKIKRKLRRMTEQTIKKRNSKCVSPEEAAADLLKRFNAFFFGTPGNGKMLSWSRWAFPVITNTTSLEEIDHYFQDSLRYVLYGSMKKRKQSIPYERLNTLGYKSLVYYYHHQNKIPAAQAAAQAAMRPAEQ